MKIIKTLRSWLCKLVKKQNQGMKTFWKFWQLESIWQMPLIKTSLYTPISLTLKNLRLTGIYIILTLVLTFLYISAFAYISIFVLYISTIFFLFFCVLTGIYQFFNISADVLTFLYISVIFLLSTIYIPILCINIFIYINILSLL